MLYLNIGDKVTNKKLSQIIIGTVIGLLPGLYYNGKQTWYTIYPNWKDNYIVYVLLDQSIKLHNKEESCLIFPIDDLVKFSDVGEDL